MIYVQVAILVVNVITLLCLRRVDQNLVKTVRWISKDQLGRPYDG